MYLPTIANMSISDKQHLNQTIEKHYQDLMILNTPMKYRGEQVDEVINSSVTTVI